MPYEHPFPRRLPRPAVHALLLALLATLLLSGAGTADGAAPDGPRADTTPAAATTSAADTAATGTPLRDNGLYPRALRLEHNGDANGRVLASAVTFDRGNGLGAIHESTDDGQTFAQVGTVADPEAGGDQGLCCATLYELPQQVGSLPAGTLLWAASVGQSEPDRRMALRVFRSNDVGRTWEYLSTVATAPNDRGLWEPEFSLDAEGNLVCHYADETDGFHSQKLVAARTSDGVAWRDHRDTVASTLAPDRPGMPVVRKLPDGTYYMSYEICAPAGQFACVAHYRTSPDGWDWGDPAHLGFRPETADGKYFKHAPNIAWAPEPGNPQGRLLMVGQVMFNADGTRAAGNGKTVWTNSDSGRGPWREIPAPVAVDFDTIDFCPNYSSALLPSTDGSRFLEIATDYDGGVCKPYYATGPT